MDVREGEEGGRKGRGWVDVREGEEGGCKGRGGGWM